MFIWCKNSGETVFPNARMGREDSAFLALHSAKNALARGQILLRDFGDFSIDAVQFSGLTGGVTEEMLSVKIQKCTIFNDGMPYPDRLEPFAPPVAVKAHTTQCVWVEVRVPADAQTGEAAFDVICQTSAGTYTAHMSLRIYGVCVPDAAQGVLNHEYFFHTGAKKIFGDAYAAYSPEWWGLMDAYAHAMRELRVNCLYLHLLPLLSTGASRKTGEDTWSLDFSRVDAFVRFFLERGSFRHIVLTALSDSLTGAHLQSFDEEGKQVTLDAGTPAWRTWVQALYSTVYRHFAENGWADMLLVHIADEPHQTDNWLLIREILRTAMPGVCCSEPLDMTKSALELAGACDVFVPRLEIYEKEASFFAARQEAGDAVWCYSCCFPEEPWYLNKFIDQPARYCRFIKWACFARGITGFLHWGFNFWDGAMYGLMLEARFKGDGFIVYPDPARGGVLHSNRGMATVEGIQEYELLQIASRKNPQAAMAVALSVARSFSDFTDDPAVLESARIRLLALCEG